MTLSLGANVHPNRSTLRSPAGLRAACSSIFNERAPTPPRFIGQSGIMAQPPWHLRHNTGTKHLYVTDGIEAEAARDAGLHKFDDASNGGLRLVRLYEVEVALGSG